MDDLGMCRWAGCEEEATTAFEVQWGGQSRLAGGRFFPVSYEKVGLCDGHAGAIMGGHDELRVSTPWPEERGGG